MEQRLDLGILCQELDELDEAIAQFQRVEADETLRPVALVHAAECFLAKDMYDIAINQYEACLGPDETLRRNNIDIHYGLAKAYELSGKYEEAKRLYESILAIEYHYEDVRERLDNVNDLAAALGGQTTTAATDAVAPTIMMDQQFQRLSAAAKDRYAIKRQLGKGGMGTVYLAEDRRLRRTVALKVLSPDLASDDGLRLRMIREAQAVAQINHHNVVGVFDVGEEAGRSYISMEYVDGPTLGGLLAEKGRLDVAECVDLLRQVSAGLGCAHAKGIMHRDVKPANVMISGEGTAKIMDFGLAIVRGATRVTMPGLVSGTWNYMAPEQARGEEDLGCGVDVYAMGCMAYELLSGKPPFVGGDVAVQHQTRGPRPLSEVRDDVPEALCAVVMKCLEKQPADRYPDCNALQKALRGVERQL